MASTRLDLATAALVLMYSTFASWASAEELCMYTNERGSFVQVNGRASLPSAFAEKATCFKVPTATDSSKDSARKASSSLNTISPKNSTAIAAMALPSEVTLSGNLRKESLDSALGRIDLRWPRSVEPLFGASPERAVINAANTINKTLRQERFSDYLRGVDLNWQIVMIDQQMAANEIPIELRANCHPGWMTPPANIYLVAQRIAGNCSAETIKPQKPSDAKLEQVLLHEFGHVVEYYLLGKNMALDRMRAEGFATWFATVASQYAKHNSRSTIEHQLLNEAKLAIQSSPSSFAFQGTSYDYSRAALYFLTVEKEKGVPGVLAMYKLFASKRSALLHAAVDVLRMSEEEITEKMKELVGIK